jgi:hypothetical protein
MKNDFNRKVLLKNVRFSAISSHLMKDFLHELSFEDIGIDLFKELKKRLCCDVVEANLFISPKSIIPRKISSSPNFLICKICSNLIQSPLLLPCNHSFCASCIEKLISSKKYSCPFCESEFPSTTTSKDLKSDLIFTKLFKFSQ